MGVIELRQRYQPGGGYVPLEHQQQDCGSDQDSGVENDDSVDGDDEYNSSVNKWSRFRKASRERLLRGFFPLRKTVEDVRHHPAAPRVYRFICLFSLWGVVFLAVIARMLLTDSPYIKLSDPKLDKRELGWVVVEATCMYAFVGCASAYAWYRSTNQHHHHQPTYSRVRDPNHESYL